MGLIVSISGIRGIVGETLTPRAALEFAQAYGTLLEGGRVALGRDTRVSGEMFASAAAAGLLAAGCQVTQLGVVMTPTLGFAIRQGGFDGGVSITASHNPPEYNGIKLLDENGLAPDAGRAARVAEIRGQGAYRVERDAFRPLLVDDQAGERHVEAVLDLVEVDMRPLRGVRVVLDSVNGAGCVDSPALLAGVGCELVHINGEPTGHFAHAPEPVAENLGQLCEAVRQTNAAVGFAQDPDADRLAVVDEHGRYIGEEYTLALAARSMLMRERGPVAANLGTSRLIDDVAREFGVPVHRTPVGEAHVARAIMAEGCVIGGEGNGGVIDPRICPVRDSLSAMSLVLQLMAMTGSSIGDLVAGLPRYAMVKRKFECPQAQVADVVARAAQVWADEPGARVDRSDGVRVDVGDAWVQVRGSNTEPIVRVIAEAPRAETCEDMIRRVRDATGL